MKLTGIWNWSVVVCNKKYSKHPSILRIKQYFKNPTEFSFVPVDKDVIAKTITAPQDDIPVKILKLNNDIFSQYLSQIFNENIKIKLIKLIKIK